MRLWLDADGCPGVVKEIVFRASTRLQLETFVVANRQVHVPPTPYLKMIVVQKGPDEADNYICAQAAAGDVAITADVPLAEQLVRKGVRVINPRGQIYTQENIGELAATRNLMDQLRTTGELNRGGGPSGYSDSDRNKFAQSLDKVLAKVVRK